MIQLLPSWMQPLILLLIVVPILCLVLGYILLVLITLLLAEVTRQRRQGGTLPPSALSLCTGRVSHRRQIPTVHAFSYPIFMALIDLTSIDNEEGDTMLWPLSMVMKLCDEDHYKNGEGYDEQGNDTTTTNSTRTDPSKNDTDQQRHPYPLSLAERTFRLVAQRTRNKFTPSSETHSVFLLTHLRYFGYCFNPVSFYYILSNDNNNNKIDAIVAEVSNTPWNEMQCYVLHPDSLDHIKSINIRDDSSINYVFRKTFHVSPFMDMKHDYDWIFWNLNLDGDKQKESSPSTSTSSSSTKQQPHIRISTKMKKENDVYFIAHLALHKKDTSISYPNNSTYHWAKVLILYFPIYCIMLQIHIHYQAIWLFVKGIPYVPHPDETETTASRWIGNLMIPFFYLKEQYDRLVLGGGSSSRNDKKKKNNKSE